eukprot:9030629-Alexandrium_andersonii.AAC.1
MCIRDRARALPQAPGPIPHPRPPAPLRGSHALLPPSAPPRRTGWPACYPPPGIRALAQANLPRSAG